MEEEEEGEKQEEEEADALAAEIVQIFVIVLYNIV